MLLVLPAMDIVLRAFPEQAPQLLQPALVKLLAFVLSGQESGLVIASMQSLLTVCWMICCVHCSVWVAVA